MRRTLFFLLSLFLVIGVGWSQKNQISVSGVVISSGDKEPVIAASVSCVEFPTTGVLTDVKGHFSFKLPAEAKTLLISCYRLQDDPSPHQHQAHEYRPPRRGAYGAGRRGHGVW